MKGYTDLEQSKKLAEILPIESADCYWDYSFNTNGESSTEHDELDLFIETADEVSEDEKVRKEIINYFQCQSEEEPTRKEIHNKWIAWLENIPVIIDHEKRDGFHLGYKACLEEQGEQKPEENKGNIGGISSNWSEEDEENFCSVYLDVKSARQNTINSLSGELKEQEQKRMDEVISWLQSIKGRVQPKQEWSEEEYRKAYYDGYNKCNRDWIYSQSEQKPAWSEEDEQHIDSLLKRLDALCRNKFERTRFAISEDRDWLKSLKERMGGKI